MAAVTIVNLTDTTFSINGIQYQKNFVSIVNSNLVRIINVYDSGLVLQGNANFVNYTVNGSSFASAQLLQDALVSVLYQPVSEGALGDLSDRVDNLEENQVTGVHVYETLAILPVTGTLLVSYKVSNDTPSSNNGFYHWNGSLPYVKDASLANGEIEAGNVEAVEGGKIYDYVNEIKNKAFTSDSTANSVVKELFIIDASRIISDVYRIRSIDILAGVINVQKNGATYALFNNGDETVSDNGNILTFNSDTGYIILNSEMAVELGEPFVLDDAIININAFNVENSPTINSYINSKYFDKTYNIDLITPKGSGYYDLAGALIVARDNIKGNARLNCKIKFIIDIDGIDLKTTEYYEYLKGVATSDGAFTSLSSWKLLSISGAIVNSDSFISSAESNSVDVVDVAKEIYYPKADDGTFTIRQIQWLSDDTFIVTLKQGATIISRCELLMTEDDFKKPIRLDEYLGSGEIAYIYIDPSLLIRDTNYLFTDAFLQSLSFDFENTTKIKRAIDKFQMSKMYQLDWDALGDSYTTPSAYQNYIKNRTDVNLINHGNVGSTVGNNGLPQQLIDAVSGVASDYVVVGDVYSFEPNAGELCTFEIKAASGVNLEITFEVLTGNLYNQLSATTIGKQCTRVSGTGDLNFTFGTHVRIEPFFYRASRISNVDIITIFGSINDAGNPIGDINTVDVTTYMGGLKQVIETIIANNPESTILTITPNKQQSGTGIDNTDVELISNAMIEVSKLYSIPNLNLFDSVNGFSGLAAQSIYWGGVGNIHPSTLGYGKLSIPIENFINENIVIKNILTSEF